jgi:hypothetical protein
VATIEEKRAQRLKFMRLLYEATRGDTFKTLNMQVLGDELQLSQTETGTLVDYLVNERLVEWAAFGGFIRIAHWGVVEVEEALSTPTRATQHFPPAVNVIHVQTMIGSQIQQGADGSSQSMINLQPHDLEAIRRFAAEVRAVETELGLSPDARQDLDAELATLEAQLRSRTPKRSVLQSALDTTKDILKSAPGQAAVAELIKQLPELLGR